jgi:hypothetical protein
MKYLNQQLKNKQNNARTITAHGAFCKKMRKATKD